jgi:YggT family protein
MAIVYSVLLVVLWLFLLALVARVVIELLQAFARDFRPHGFALVFFEVIYTLTDPPLRALRRVIPPLRIGAIAFDLAILVLFIAVNLLISVVGALARHSS